MVGEVIVISTLRHARIPVLQIGWAEADPRVAVPEAVLGLLTVAVVAAIGFRPRAQRD